MGEAHKLSDAEGLGVWLWCVDGDVRYQILLEVLLDFAEVGILGFRKAGLKCG